MAGRNLHQIAATELYCLFTLRSMIGNYWAMGNAGVEGSVAVNFSHTFFGYTSLFLGISILPHFFQPRCSWQEKQNSKQEIFVFSKLAFAIKQNKTT